MQRIVSEQSAILQEEEYVKRPEVKITIPDALKVQLVDDWENVTKKDEVRGRACQTLETNIALLTHILVLMLTAGAFASKTMCSGNFGRVQGSLSCSQEGRQKVGDLRKVIEERSCLPDADTESLLNYSTVFARTPQVVEEVLKGLKLYFDRSLGQNLLYRFERAQFVEYRKKNGPKMGDGDVGSSSKSGNGSMGGETEPSDVYGAEHLLRLFVNLPMIIVHTSMDAESISLLKEHLAEFLS